MISTYIILCCALLTFSCAEKLNETSSSRRNGRDSYLDAYTQSHSSGISQINKDREYVESQGYPYSQYGPPTGPSGPPKIVYGPPHAPIPQYGPPAPVYGPPPPPPYAGIPYALLNGILDKFKFKLDLFTIGKIVLKLFLFKKFVSFVAILCLLLFIPWLKKKEPSDSSSASSGEDDSFVMMRSSDGNDRINNLTSYILEAIENFNKKEKKNGNCDSIYCKTNAVLRKIDQKLSYKKLAKLYSKELQQ